MKENLLISAEWMAPPEVNALVSTRRGGGSEGPYASMNLAEHVGDRPKIVMENRIRLAELAGVPVNAFQWLHQVHGTRVIHARPDSDPVEADACVTALPGVVCTVMTADCLPVFFCARDGSQVGVAHAGWRGLLDGVLENTVSAFTVAPSQLLVWLGPAISQAAFEVGGEVRAAFVSRCSEMTAAFLPSPSRPGHWMADLYQLARMALRSVGVTAVSGGDYCTFRQSDLFYSYRRASPTGRMTSFIWITSESSA